FEIAPRNPIFHRLLDRLPPATWLDPPDECGTAVFPKPTSPLLDRSHICDTIPPRDVRRLFPPPSRPNFPYALASALLPDNPRSASTPLPHADAHRSLLATPRWCSGALELFFLGHRARAGAILWRSFRQRLATRQTGLKP